jgi:hypothetical protein
VPKGDYSSFLGRQWPREPMRVAIHPPIVFVINRVCRLIVNRKGME